LRSSKICSCIAILQCASSALASRSPGLRHFCRSSRNPPFPTPSMDMPISQKEKPWPVSGWQTRESLLQTSAPRALRGGSTEDALETDAVGVASPLVSDHGGGKQDDDGAVSSAACLAIVPVAVTSTAHDDGDMSRRDIRLQPERVVEYRGGDVPWSLRISQVPGQVSLSLSLHTSLVRQFVRSFAFSLPRSTLPP